MSDIRDLRNQKTNKITYSDANGRVCEFKTASLRLPWIISKLWSNKLIGERPDIFYAETVKADDWSTDGDVSIETSVSEEKEKKRVPYNIEIEDIVIECLLTGIVCFIPKYIEDKYFIDIVPSGKYEYVESETGRLLYFKYTKDNVKILVDNKPVSVSITSVYSIDENNKAWLQETYSGGVERVNDPILLGSELPPKIVRLSKSEPIWINAFNQIKDANDTYTEMMFDMDLSRKLLALPDRYINKNKDPRNKDMMLSISETHRAVRAMPMGNGKDEGAIGNPQWFEGKYNPEPFLDTINFQLHLISLNCYFGSRYLSYDKQSNEITATEVNSTDNDLYINRLSLLSYVESIYTHIIKTFDMLTNSEIRELVFEHGDSIFDNQDKKNNQMSMDASIGLMNKKKYLMERYGLSDKEVIDWLPESDVNDE